MWNYLAKVLLESGQGKRYRSRSVMFVHPNNYKLTPPRAHNQKLILNTSRLTQKGNPMQLHVFSDLPAEQSSFNIFVLSKLFNSFQG
jgi:hypothetical protein